MKSGRQTQPVLATSPFNDGGGCGGKVTTIRDSERMENATKSVF